MSILINEDEAKSLEVEEECTRDKDRIKKMYLGTILMALGSFLILIDTY